MNDPRPIASELHRSPTCVTWDAKEPPHELRAWIDRMANPPLSPLEQEIVRRWTAACEKIDGKPPELNPATKEKWL